MEQLAELPQLPWIIAVALLAVVLAFLAGRASKGSSSGDAEKVQKLEEALAESRAEMAAYREQVNTHFERTAELFVAVAEPCKALFEHVAAGYDSLHAPKGDGSPQVDFRETVLRRIGNGTTLDAAPQPEPDVSAAPSVTEAQALSGDVPHLDPDIAKARAADDAAKAAKAGQSAAPERREPGLNDNVG